MGYLSKEVTLSPSEDNPMLIVGIEPQPQDIAAVFVVGRKADKALQANTQEHKMKMAPEALKLLPDLGEKGILRGFQQRDQSDKRGKGKPSVRDGHECSLVNKLDAEEECARECRAVHIA